jgi:hypothetical protein
MTKSAKAKSRQRRKRLAAKKSDVDLTYTLSDVRARPKVTLTSGWRRDQPREMPLNRGI